MNLSKSGIIPVVDIAVHRTVFLLRWLVGQEAKRSFQLSPRSCHEDRNQVFLKCF